jgi:hypothetical protein
MNKWVGITLGAAAAYGIVRFLQMQNVSDKTNITLVEPRIHDVNLAGLYIRTEVQVNNQTINSVQITKPVVSLKSKGILLSQSNVEKTLTRNPFRRYKLTPTLSELLTSKNPQCYHCITP